MDGAVYPIGTSSHYWINKMISLPGASRPSTCMEQVLLMMPFTDVRRCIRVLRRLGSKALNSLVILVLVVPISAINPSRLLTVWKMTVPLFSNNTVSS